MATTVLFALLLLELSCSAATSDKVQVNEDVVGDKWKLMTYDDAEKYNNMWTLHDAKNMFSPTCSYESGRSPTDEYWHLGWCRHKGLSPKGAFKMAIIGNSYAANHANLFYQECGYKAKSILQSSAYGCEPLYPSLNYDVCKEYMNTVARRIQREQPDVAFVFTRYISIGDNSSYVLAGDIPNDPIYQVMKAQMLKLTANIKNKLYILDAYPRVSQAKIPEIAKNLKNNVDPVTIDNSLDDLGDISQSFEIARARHAQLIKDCNGKCALVDYVPKYFNKATGTYRFFDEKGFSYNTGNLHITPHGLEHVRDVWRDVCARL